MTLTAEDLAKAYVDTIYKQANGLGQHCHPLYGRSDFIMKRIWDMVGKEKGNELIDCAMFLRRYA